MIEADITLMDTDIESIEDEFEKRLQNMKIKSMDFQINDTGYCLLWRDFSRAILYEKKVYFYARGSVYYVHLHALRTYKTLNDALDNIDGDLCYYEYDLPIKDGDDYEYI